MVKPPLRTKSLGTKVSDGEYARLEALASAHGQTIRELIRSVLLGRTGAGAPLIPSVGVSGRSRR